MRITSRCQCRGVPCGRPHCEEACVKVGRTFLSARFDADDVSAQMCLRRFCLEDNRTDGRFFDFAQNDMLCNIHRRNLSAKSRHKLSS